MNTVRIIIPAFPGINIFSRQAKRTTALGPVLLATVISMIKGFRVEVIDENNYHGPRDKNGLPDHVALQRDNPAVIVGFYCGLTCTIERVWQLAKFYKEQFYKGQRVFTIAGGWHAHYEPEETLNHNIDVVFHGDAELVIQEVIESLINGISLEKIAGISFKVNGKIQTNKPKNKSGMLENQDMDSLPYPDFDLLRFAKIRTYPVGRTRGCSMNCEGCGVKGEPRYASPRYLFNTVEELVRKRKAKHFFIVDDRLEQDSEGTMEFFKSIYNKYKNKLCFTVQIRLDIAKNIPLLKIMKKAGVRCACIGYESPIDQDLKAMRKGYSSEKNMIEWTKVLLRYVKWIHAMLMIGYPSEQGQISFAPKEIVRIYKRFIRKAGVHSIQVLATTPIVGSDLRKRITDRIFPLDLVPWSRYDGTFPCFKPDNMTVEELQWIGIKLMKGFYQKMSLIRISIRTIVFPVDLFIKGLERSCRDWKRDGINFLSHRLLGKWLKRHQDKRLIEELDRYKFNSRP